MRLAVRVTPRAGEDRIVGIVDGEVRVRVAAAPADGAANAALVGLLAAVIGVAPGKVRLVTGQTSRRKVVEIADVTAAEALARFPGLAL